MTLVEPTSAMAATTTAVCSKCHQRIAPPPARPAFVTNMFHSPNSLFRQQHKARTSGGGLCECPSSDQPQQHQPQQRQHATTAPLSPRPVELIHGNHNNNDDHDDQDDDEDDDGLESIEVALKHLDDSHPVIWKPMAGSSTIHLEQEEDAPQQQHHQHPANTNHTPTHHNGITWQRPGRNLSPIRVRSLQYRQNKMKQPSPCDLYQCVAVDFVKASHRLCPMSSRVQLPPMVHDEADHSATNHNNNNAKTWHAPDIFVVSVSLPAKASNKKKNGVDQHSHHSRHQEQQQRATGEQASPPVDEVEGYTVSMYFRMTAETRAILQRVTSPNYPATSSHQHDNTSSVNAVKLFDEWCRKSPTDPKFQGRFKLIPHIHNPKEIGLPTWMAAYNAKPLLIKRSGTTGILYSTPSSSTTTSSSTNPSPSVLEFEVNFHPFPFLARQALQHLMEHSFDKLQLTLAFLIEGRSEDELPECVIGQAYFCHPQVKSSATAETLFASGAVPHETNR